MGNWFIYLWIATLAGFFLWSAIDERKRNRAMEKLVARLGFKSWGDRLPSDLSLAGTPFNWASSIWNAMEGTQNGIRVVVFDCRMGTGKGSWRRTVIAAQSPIDVFASVPTDTSYTVDRCGEWAVLYAPREISFFTRGVMPVAELEARISTLG